MEFAVVYHGQKEIQRLWMLCGEEVVTEVDTLDDEESGEDV